MDTIAADMDICSFFVVHYLIPPSTQKILPTFFGELLLLHTMWFLLGLMVISGILTSLVPRVDM